MPTGVKSTKPKQKTTASGSSKSTTTKSESPIISFSNNEGSRFMRVLSCGKAKTGKTTFAGSWPKPFFLDCDKGMMTLSSKSIPYYQFSRGSHVWKDLLDVINQLIDRSGPVWSALEENNYIPETVVLDSITALSDLMEVEVINFPPDNRDRQNQLQIQDYNTIQRRIYGVLDLMREMPYHMICTTGIEYTEDDASGALLENPAATGRKIGPRIPHFFDEVYLHSYDAQKKSWILTPVQTYRFPHAGSRKGIPMEPILNPTYDELKKYYK